MKILYVKHLKHIALRGVTIQRRKNANRMSLPTYLQVMFWTHKQGLTWETLRVLQGLPTMPQQIYANPRRVRCNVRKAMP